MTTPSPHDRRNLGRRRIRIATGAATLTATGLAAVLSVLLAQGTSSATSDRSTDSANTSTAQNSPNSSSSQGSQDSRGSDDTRLQAPDQVPSESGGGWSHASSGGS